MNDDPVFPQHGDAFDKVFLSVTIVLVGIVIIAITAILGLGYFIWSLLGLFAGVATLTLWQALGFWIAFRFFLACGMFYWTGIILGLIIYCLTKNKDLEDVPWSAPIAAVIFVLGGWLTRWNLETPTALVAASIAFETSVLIFATIKSYRGS